MQISKSDIVSFLNCRPLFFLLAFLGCELLLILLLDGSSVFRAAWVRSLVTAAASISPVVHRYDQLASAESGVSFWLAISPPLLILKSYLCIQWMKSDMVRVYRYLVISPLTKTVPKHSGDFVTDSLRSDIENKSPDRVESISTKRATIVSAIFLVMALVAAIVGPYFIYGSASGVLGIDPRHLAILQNGFQLWLWWAVLQMMFSAGLLAMAYCIATEYVVWIKSLLSNGKTANGQS